MTGKTDKQFLFEVQLNWLSDTRGILIAKDAKGSVQVATAPEFGGQGNPWTPEHLFLSSVSSCFMTTYISFAKELQFDISDMDCNAIGQIEIVEGKFQITHINLYPRIYIANEDLREKAILAIEKTQHNSLVAGSINATILYHSEILLHVDMLYGKKEKADVRTGFSKEEATLIGNKLKIDFSKYSLEEFRRGLEVELEHGKRNSVTNITDNNEYITGKIAWAHLNEIPDYYTRLDKMEKEAEVAVK